MHEESPEWDGVVDAKRSGRGDAEGVRGAFRSGCESAQSTEDIGADVDIHQGTSFESTTGKQ